MKTFALAGAAAIALIAVPASAQKAVPSGPAPTRAATQASIKTEFAKVDADKDGFVTQGEATAATAAARTEVEKLRAESRAEAFARLDTNKDGSISRAEFETPATEGKTAGAERPDRQVDQPRRATILAGLMFAPGRFQAMDADKDSKISLAEASAQGLARFDRIDTNHDGTISPDEGRAAQAAARAQRQKRQGS